MKYFNKFLIFIALTLAVNVSFGAKLTSLTTLGNPAIVDVVHVVDVSDTSSDPAGTSKQATLGSIGVLFQANTSVLINTKTDLPAPSAGVITLVANTNYVLGDNVSLGTDRLDVSAGNISWTSNNLAGPTLTYTGTGTLFTGVDAQFTASNARFDVPNGKVFDLSDVASPGSSIVLLDTIQVDSCTSFGDFDDLLSIVVENSNALNCTQGVVLTGSNWLIQSFVKFALGSSSAAFVGIDLGTSVTANAEIANLFFIGVSGAVGVSGVANSANISVGSIGTFRDSAFVGDISPISGLTVDDIRWAFALNGGIADTMPDAMASLNSNATETVITVQGTAVKVAGTWVGERESHFTADTTGRITYNGERPLTTPVDITTIVNSASGNNKDISVCLALNAVVIANSCKANRVSSTDPASTTVLWQLTMVQTDFLEVFIANDSDTVNMVVSSAIHRAR